MSTSDEIKNELDSLLENQDELIKLAKKDEDILEFGTMYQKWYSRAYKIVESLGPERLEEFISYYLIDPKRKEKNKSTYVIQDYIKGEGAKLNYNHEPIWNTHNVTIVRLLNQMQIIASLSSRIDSVLQDVKGHLFAELQDTELKAAVQLKKVNMRAAGALAGVVLERHLQRTAQNHKVVVRKKSPTISDLNDPLKQKGVYGVPVWRKIQLLADIRNICSHQKETEPSVDQVDELITGVDTIIKSVF